MAGKQPKFLVSRAKGARFEPMTGFRDWLSIRDLGLEDATHGEYRAFITRANEMGHATGAHYHEMEFQIIYVLKGWVKFHCAGEGEMTLEEGDFVYHPPRIVHDLLDYSEDVELFELYSPARRETVNV